MTKILALLFLLCISVGSSVLSMIYGWGIQPKSWAWIIGVGIFIQMFVHLSASYIEKK